ncbi:glycosyltransferase family 4 protein [Xylanimonas ulmi]|uniref:Glycosyltransferase involved in cell wall biosynthesis n=1 Tax=Xylanimonas ulmi TaxID=228973 RepID=A0A4Q7M7G1_9MICO|nr:glycosyltransferase family 4 protein [Xylanibacterium ulmi]RZS62049.1 glycosyltransferase involved in cell wall biosynthesis [Xylanibacterium ulmi]
MTSRLTRARELARNARFAASFVLHALAEDPIRLARLAARRLAIARRARRHRPTPHSVVEPVETTPLPVKPAETTPPLTVLHHLTNSLPHTQSGYTLRSHAILRAQQDAGLTVHATTRAGYPLTIGSLTARHIDVVDHVAYERLIPAAIRRDPARRLADAVGLLASAAERAGAQVIHATTPATTGEVARGAAERLGLPWVYEVRGLPEETWAASHATPEERAAAESSAEYRERRARETELALAADAVVTLSDTMRDELVSRGVPAERIAVVPNAVPTALLDAEHPTMAQARAALGLPVEGLMVGAVSSLVGYEGQDTILLAVAELRSRGLDARALLVGDGVSRPALVALAADLGLTLGEHAILPGRVPPTTAATYVAALDVVMVPRRPDRVTRLVTPLKPVEAMAIGRPVVASGLPALAEACGGAGVLVAPDDVAAWAHAVERLAKDPAYRRAVVNAGTHVAQARTWPNLIPTYLEVYSHAREASPDDAHRRQGSR